MNSWVIAMHLLKRVIGNRKGLITRIVLPVAVISGMIAIIGGVGPGPVKVAYMNEDRGELGAHVLQGLTNKMNIEFVESSGAPDMKEAVISHRVAGALAIPSDFTARLLAGEPSKAMMYQLNESEESVKLQLYIDLEIQRIEQAVSTSKFAAADGSEAEQTKLLETLLQAQEKRIVETKEADFGLARNPLASTVIGIIVLFILLACNGSIYSVVEDREQLTMARMYTAPVNAFEIAAGNFIGAFLVGTIQMAVTLLFTRYAVGYDYGMPLVQLFVILECFLLAAIGMASATASMVKNPAGLGHINTLIVTPTCMLGGCFWPLYIMPDYMQKIANFVPQKWAIDAAGKLASGGEFESVIIHIGILLLFAVVLLAFGAFVLKPGQSPAR